ncbi:hypothetical protein [Bradyrhizobium sp. CCBAU 65884]|uniref:hypothetical protein n=1 Tax=Bradyrhizobium sp. CCBAU 65884 TaxID=722477 RepID=UPI002304EF16|nr:hypothetical protein [Bradyrhizobium sp. CCBAU 65884]
MSNLFLFVFLCGGVGAMIPIALWCFLDVHRRRNQRLVDLLSYAITVVAVISAAFSLVNDNRQWTDAIKRMQASEKRIGAGFDDVVEYSRICQPHLAMSSTRRAECDQLWAYLSTRLTGVPGVPSLVALPHWPAFSNPAVSTFADKVVKRVTEANKAALAYSQILTIGPDPAEATFRNWGAPLLAFAVGLGLARRFLDLCQDWKASEPKRKLLRAVAPKEEIGRSPGTTYEARSQMNDSQPAALQLPRSEPFATEDLSKSPSGAQFEDSRAGRSV